MNDFINFFISRRKQRNWDQNFLMAKQAKEWTLVTAKKSWIAPIRLRRKTLVNATAFAPLTKI